MSTVLPLPSGRLVVAGSFTQVRGVRSDGIALLEPDGRGVATFQPDCRGVPTGESLPRCGIGRMVLGTDGSILVAGGFHAFGSVQRAGLAKLDPDTGIVDPAWNPFAAIAPAPVFGLSIVGDRVLLLLGGTTQRLVSVSLDGAGLPTPGFVTFALPGTHWVVGGPEHVYFAQGPTDAQRVQRVRLATGEIDPDWRSREFNRIEAIAWDPVGNSVLIAGVEPFAGGLLGRLLVRVGAGLGAPEWPGWNVFQFQVSRYLGLQTVGGSLFAHACRADFFTCPAAALSAVGQWPAGSGLPGLLPLGFLGIAGIDATGRAYLQINPFNYASPSADGSRLARLTSDGLLDADFRPRIRSDAGIARLAASRSGDIVLQGFFRWVDDLPADKFLRLRAVDDRLTDWRPFGPTCEPSVCESTTAIAVDAGNHTFIATRFFSDDSSLAPPSLRRYQPEGAPLEAWHAGRLIGTYAGGDARIDALVIDDANGWLYLGGRFEGDVCGQPRRNLARVTLAAPCRADPAWQPDPDGVVASLAIDGNGRLVVGGEFRVIAGQPLAHLVRFDAGVLDTGWQPVQPGLAAITIPKLATTRNHVFAEVEQTLPGSLPTRGLLRFDSDSTPIGPTWNPPPAARIDLLLATPGGQLFAVRRGVVPSPFASPIDRIEVFDPAGAGTPRAAINISSDQRILAAAPRADGGLLLGGVFNRIGSAARTNLASVYAEPVTIFAASFE